MKVLFASLARIGDYIQHMSVIKAWHLAHPDADVHIVVNDLIPAELMRMNSQFKHFVFSRFQFQKQINQVGTPLLYPFVSFRQLILNLRSEEYTDIFDLTLQNQSAEFLKLVNPKFSYSEDESRVASEYLDSKDQHHLIDKLKTIYKLPIEPHGSVAGWPKRILFQVTTSDKKKNVDLEKWKALIDDLRVDQRSIEFFILGSSNERHLLTQTFSIEQVLICNFTELSHLFDGQTYLVSLDTSIKHFASWFQVPTMEISVGSSHPIKNAAYQSGNYVFSADYHCRPCSHSNTCPYERNLCQDEINFQELKIFVNEWITELSPVSFAMKTENQLGNLGLLINNARGEKWNQRTNQINPSL